MPRRFQRRNWLSFVIMVWEVEDILKRLRMDYCTEGNIDDKEMKWAIDTINALTERI